MSGINTIKLCDWIDTKFSQTKNSTYTFREKVAIYNTLIELQEFMKKNLDEQIEGIKEKGEESANAKRDGVRYPD